jgi:hypothetical protein
MSLRPEKMQTQFINIFDMSYINISLSELESKRKKLIEELGHIDWVINNFKKDEQPENVGRNSSIQIDVTHGHGLLTVQNLIEKILREKKPNALSSDEILREMIAMGRDIKKANLFAHLSRYTNYTLYPSSKIQRVEMNKYSVKD